MWISLDLFIINIVAERKRLLWRDQERDLYMSIGVMKDEELELRDLHVSHTLGWSGDWTPEDRDEVKRREVWECEGWVCDLEDIDTINI
jgi:hypothetical protein